jgi:hypothetical protein
MAYRSRVACSERILLIITAGLQFPVVADPFTPPLKFIAPTLNLTVEFHTFHPEAEWMLADATGYLRRRRYPRCGDEDVDAGRHLLATAHSQMTYHDFSEPMVTKGLQRSWFEPQED